jgi:hypothetical protein
MTATMVLIALFLAIGIIVGAVAAVAVSVLRRDVGGVREANHPRRRPCDTALIRRVSPAGGNGLEGRYRGHRRDRRNDVAQVTLLPWDQLPCCL